MKRRTASMHRNTKNKLLDQLRAASNDARLLSVARRLVVLANQWNAQNRHFLNSDSPVITMPTLEEIKRSRFKMR